MLKQQGVDPRALIADLYHAIHDKVLPDDNEVPANSARMSVKDAWQNGCDRIVGGPEVPKCRSDSHPTSGQAAWRGSTRSTESPASLLTLT